LLDGDIPDALDIPTGLGKTAVIAIWLAARVSGASLPRRLVYVVDRRAVVDQATTEAIAVAANLENALAFLPSTKPNFGEELSVSTQIGCPFPLSAANLPIIGSGSRTPFSHRSLSAPST
jgi:CRISPR-associated endonuclease/helicase Cas3